jgi:hypothetical protein
MTGGETGGKTGDWWTRWLFAPVPAARVGWFRLLVYAFIPFDVLVARPWGALHGQVSTELYQPLLIGRVLPLPAPTAAVVAVVQWALVAVSLTALVFAARGRAPRVLGLGVALLYLQWMVIAFSYGKVDHDRFAFISALFVLPFAGLAGLRDEAPSASAGWALRVVQIGAVATYFFAAIAKLRFGGLAWLTSATLARAIIRRGTFLADPLLQIPWALVASQFFIMAFELLSPVILFVRERWQWLMVAGLLLFHLSVYATITIIFLPHLVCLMAFLPLERLGRLLPARAAAAA